MQQQEIRAPDVLRWCCMPGVAGRSGGRNARGTNDHLVRGTFRRDRHEGAASVVATPGPPEPPKPLAGDAKEEWDRVVLALSDTGAISVVDGSVLYDYCRLFADAERLQKAVDALEMPFFEKVTVDGAGQEHSEPKVHPGFAQLRAYRQALRSYLVEFGLTPASRNRVKTLKPTTPQNEWAEIGIA